MIFSLNDKQLKRLEIWRKGILKKEDIDDMSLEDHSGGVCPIVFEFRQTGITTITKAHCRNQVIDLTLDDDGEFVKSDDECIEIIDQVVYVVETETSCVGAFTTPRKAIESVRKIVNGKIEISFFTAGVWSHKYIPVEEEIERAMNPDADYPIITAVPIDSNNPWTRDS